MEEEFRALLLAAPGVTELAGGRVNWGAHPQGEASPYIVLTVVSDIDRYLLNGREGRANARVQVDCYGRTYGDAKRLARAVKGELSGRIGTRIEAIFHAGAREGREGGRNEPERLFRISHDFTLTYID